MTRTLTFSSRMWSIVTLAAVVGAAAVVLAQGPAAGGHHEAVTGQAAGQAIPGAAEREQMMKNMAAADQKLSDLVAKMNAATGDKKVAAIAEVVTELVAQRHQMQEQMRMQRGMMDQMMSRMSAMHGSAGMMKGNAEPKAGATDADHAAHHPDK